MGQITQTTTQLQTILNDADASNAGNTSISDASDTSATSLKKSGFYSLQASSSNAPSTDRAVVISAVRDTAATGEIRYGQVVITESNGLWWNSDDGGSLGTWYESVGTTATQTLTNKTLTSPVLTTPQINDSAADHQYVFAVANLAADRTVTLPLLTGADTFVFEAHAQTLTNKILTAPVLSGSASAAGSILFKEDTDNGTNAVTLIGPAATADVTVTLPAATDTLVGKATTDTLTNKTITSVVLNTGVSGSAVLDSDTMSGASATTLSSSESIKAYVDAQVDTADTLAEILAIGNVTGGTDIATTTTDKVQFRDAAIYINSSVDGQLDIVADTEIQIAATTVDLNGNLDVSGTALVTGVLTTTATQVATGGITSGSDIISDTDSTDSLGSTAVRWLKGWFDTLTAGTLTIGSGSVTDSSGAISFGNENLTTTGIVTAAGTSVFTNLDISGDVDVDGTIEFDGLSGTGSVAVTDIKDEDNMASNSATAISTQQSIKAYVDSQVGTVDTLAEVLANGNTTGSTDIDVDGAQKVQFRDAAIYINSSTDGQLDIVADTEIQIAATTIDINGAINASGEIIAASLDVSGNIDVDGITNLDVVDIDGAVDMATTALVTGVLTTTAATVFNGGFASNSTSTITTAVDQAFPLTVSNTDADSNTYIKYLDQGGQYWTSGINYASNNFTLEYGGTNIATFANAGGLTITSADNLAQLTLISTDTDASQGPILNLNRNPAEAGADNDYIGQIYFTGHNDAGTPEDIIYAKLTSQIIDASDGAEDGNIVAFVMQGGTRKDMMRLGPDASVFNDPGNDLDFRVESDGNANMLFVDGGNDRVGIGRVPTISNSKLEVGGADNVSIINVEASGVTGGMGIGSTGLQFFHGSSSKLAIASSGAATFASSVSVGGTLQLPDVAQSIDFLQSGAINFDSNADQTGRILTIGSNRAGGISGGITNVTFDETGGSVFNEGGADADFRVESDGNANMLFVDGGNDAVGIGTSSVSSVLSVHNNISTTYSTSGYAATASNSMLYLNNTNGGSNTASLINFRAGSGDGLIGFVEGGGTNDADFIIQTDGGSNGVERFRIANDGAATFSSTLAATSATFTPSSGENVVITRDSGGPYFGTSSSHSLRIITNNAVASSITASGEVTMPLQPAFNAYPASIQSNIAINTAVTIVLGTEAFDVGSNFASNTFTAPVTGKYQLNVSLDFNNLDAEAGFYQLQLITSNKSYFKTFDPNFSADPAQWVLGVSVLADMDASDTVYVVIYQYNGTAQTDVAVATNFSGYLAC